MCCSSSASSSCASRGDITASVRKNDIAGRYLGGKEFMPLLPNCEAAIAAAIADAIAERVE
jgi:PleD family two-component response regulator